VELGWVPAAVPSRWEHVSAHTTTDVVHSLVARKDKLWTARCGHQVVTRVWEPMPARFTGWATKVTCGECRSST
jgi:hypothetical protein